MSSLTETEKRKLERILEMSTGYVIDFTNRTFEEFVRESTSKEIYDKKYDMDSGSKANRMRAFWDIEPDHIVGQLLGDIFEEWDEYKGSHNAEVPSDRCLKIVERLKSAAPIPNIDAIFANSQDKDFECVVKAVRDSINSNQPWAALDRLHTFCVKYFRKLCENYDIDINRNKPLHSLVGEYTKKMKDSGIIESDMTLRIFKSSIASMQAFNDVRNNQSLAHDNKVLGNAEAILILDHVASIIRFVEEIEKNFDRSQENQ